jgi:hypothetical protein
MPITFWLAGRGAADVIKEALGSMIHIRQLAALSFLTLLLCGHLQKYGLKLLYGHHSCLYIIRIAGPLQSLSMSGRCSIFQTHAPSCPIAFSTNLQLAHLGQMGNCPRRFAIGR